VLRDHDVLTTPNRIDCTATIRRQVPGSWRDKLGATDAEFVPLVRDVKSEQWEPGWVSYEDTVDDGPEVEVICGGFNTKTPQGAAVWRQGHLLHFGFEQAPTELNQAGTDLLANAIAYIARFTEDRPIVRAPSPFAGTAPRARESLERFLAKEPLLEWFTSALAPAAAESVTDRTLEGYRAWFARVRPFLRPGDDGLMIVDGDLQRLGLRYDEIGFFEKAMASLAAPAAPGDAEAAAAALARFAPDGPGREAAATAWRTWLDENRAYLFFSEWGGYRWYVDPLAKRRGVPTADLRGAARGDARPPG
jgi:hypothetical protein